MVLNLERGEIALFKADDGSEAVAVCFADETVWLSLNQMVDLFDRDKSVISRHLRNIYKEDELCREATVAKNATVQTEGGREVSRNIDYYNLDAIISVGYRVNSKRGTQFRIWATRILKEHLVRGFTVNQQRLAEKGIEEARQVVSLLVNTLESHDLVSDEGRLVLDIINRYADTWRLLLQYDEEALELPEGGKISGGRLDIRQVRKAIGVLKRELLAKGEATNLFGNERSDHLEGIIGSVYQTFGGQDLYPSREEKAANLLYFIVKDHPFTDGNKRIGSFLFVLFLDLNKLRSTGMFDNKALVALTLLTAASDPVQKEVLIRLIVNLLAENSEG